MQNIYQIGAWRTEYGAFIVTAPDEETARSQAQELLENGEDFHKTTDAESSLENSEVIGIEE